MLMQMLPGFVMMALLACAGSFVGPSDDGSYLLPADKESCIEGTSLTIKPKHIIKDIVSGPPHEIEHVTLELRDGNQKKNASLDTHRNKGVRFGSFDITLVYADAYRNEARIRVSPLKPKK